MFWSLEKRLHMCAMSWKKGSRRPVIFLGGGGLRWRPLVEVSVSSWAASIPHCEAVCWHTSYCGMVKGHLHDFQKMQILLCFFFFLHQLWCWEEAAGGLCSVFPEVYDEFLGFCCCLVSDCFLTLGLLLCKQTHLLLKWGWLQWCHVLINKCRFNIYYINIDILYQYLTYIILQHFK